ncbi:MAG: class I SAM-dependent methyltransferase [Planctomycetes bacterium]|nr:class I SAM-dependent methyltransferase [Planctomycetota bacterium]
MDPKVQFWRDHSERKAAEFGRSCRAHDYRNERVLRLTRAYLLRLFEGKRGLWILDVGCGNGTFLSPLVGQHQVVGVDISPGMLCLARKGGFRVVNGLAESLPFRSGQFDAALCVEMFQCVDTGAVIVQEMVRVLKPGGLLAVQTLNRASWIRRVHRWLDRESRQLRMYRAEELLHYAILPEIDQRRIIYNFYPAGKTAVREEACCLFDLAATSFALVAVKKGRETP